MIIRTAEVVLSASSPGSSSRHHASHWVPVLPAALAALPAVLNHTDGVHKTAQRLLQDHEQQQDQLAAATRNRGKGQPLASAAVAPCRTGLLNLSYVNNFLSSAACIAASHAAAGGDDTAVAEATAALQVANTLFAKQLVAVQVGVATGSAAGCSSGLRATADTSGKPEGVHPDGITYGCLLRLYGLTDQLQQVAGITVAAVKLQLGLGPSSRSSSADELQEVLAGAAAAWLSAGAAEVVFMLLDGAAAARITQINHAGLIQQLLKAAEADEETASQVSITSARQLL